MMRLKQLHCNEMRHGLLELKLFTANASCSRPEKAVEARHDAQKLLAEDSPYSRGLERLGLRQGDVGIMGPDDMTETRKVSRH